MPLFSSADDATRSSYRAVLYCVIGAISGVAAGWFLSSFNDQGYLPMGPFTLIVFGLLYTNVMLRWRRPSYDPNTTFITFLMTLFGANWVLQFFFIEPGLGPFAAQVWTVPNAVANALFGIIVFGLIGTVVGLTYYAARRSYAALTWRRIVFGVIGVGFPLVLCSFCEYLLVHPPL